MTRFGPWDLAAVATLALMLVLALLPTYWMLLASLRGDEALAAWPPRFLPRLDELTLDAYRIVLRQARTWAWLGNSLLITAASLGATLVVAAPAAFALSRADGRTMTAIGGLMFASKLLPATILLTPLYVMARGFGLLNSPAAVVFGNLSFAVPLATFVLKGYFDAIPRAMDEAAMIDGASRLRVLASIVLPNALPAVLAVSIYVFIVSWNDFIFARTFLSGGNATTITVGATMSMGEYETRWNQLMAIGCLATLPCLAFFLLLQRHLTRGLASMGH